MKTAIEWLYNELSKNNTSTDSVIERINKELSIWEQAKEMEKEQIIDAYLQGSFDNGPDSNNAEQYYNQTYHEEDDWGGLSNEELIGDDEIPKF